MRRTSSLLAALALAACGAHAPPRPIELHAQTAAAGLPDDGACLVVRFPDGTIRQSDPARCAIRLRPASTFKLPNTLIGADVGLLDGPDAIMHYDPERYPPDTVWNADWRRDLPLREALEISAVPLFQLLAIRIGAERMQAHLDAIGYGNHDTSGGLDQFWLSGGLAISAREQVDFLTRLLAGTLPVSARAHAIVRAAAPTETAPDATLHWKTGTGQLDDQTWVGWLVGWIDRPEGTHVFACWIREPGDFQKVRADRTAVCRGALAGLGLFPAPAP